MQYILPNLTIMQNTRISCKKSEYSARYGIIQREFCRINQFQMRTRGRGSQKIRKIWQMLLIHAPLHKFLNKMSLNMQLISIIYRNILQNTDILCRIFLKRHNILHLTEDSGTAEYWKLEQNKILQNILQGILQNYSAEAIFVSTLVSKTLLSGRGVKRTEDCNGHVNPRAKTFHRSTKSLYRFKSGRVIIALVCLQQVQPGRIHLTLVVSLVKHLGLACAAIRCNYCDLDIPST